jgi:5'-methylthioadenosine phosphorylase
MTLMPEAALARELELPYAALGVVVNHAAGRGGSALHISVEAIGLTLDRTLAQVRAVIMTLVGSYSEK